MRIVSMVMMVMGGPPVHSGPWWGRKNTELNGGLPDLWVLWNLCDSVGTSRSLEGSMGIVHASRIPTSPSKNCHSSEGYRLSRDDAQTTCPDQGSRRACRGTKGCRNRRTPRGGGRRRNRFPWRPLGRLLGASWGPLGALLGQSWRRSIKEGRSSN